MFFTVVVYLRFLVSFIEMGTFVKTHTNLDFNEKVIAELFCTVNRSIEIGLHVARLCFVKINSTVTRLYFFAILKCI